VIGKFGYEGFLCLREREMFMNFLKIISCFVCLFLYSSAYTAGGEVTKANSKATGSFTGLTVSGPTDLKGTLMVTPQTGKKHFYIDPAGVYIGYGTGNVIVGSTSSFNAGATFNKGASIKGNVGVNGNLDLAGDINVDGKITVNGEEVGGGTEIPENIEVKTATVNEELVVNGVSSLNGVVTIAQIEDGEKPGEFNVFVPVMLPTDVTVGNPEDGGGSLNVECPATLKKEVIIGSEDKVGKKHVKKVVTKKSKSVIGEDFCASPMLTVNGDSLLLGDLGVDGVAAVKSALVVGDISKSKNLRNSRKYEVETPVLLVGGGSTFYDTATFQKGINVTGNINITDGHVYVDGELLSGGSSGEGDGDGGGCDIGDTLSLKTLTADVVNSGEIKNSGNAVIDGNLTVKGVIYGTVEGAKTEDVFSGDVSIGGNTDIAGQVHIWGKPPVTEEGEIADTKSLYVEGETTLEGDVTLANGFLRIYSSPRLTAEGEIADEAGLQVHGESLLGGDVTITHALNVMGQSSLKCEEEVASTALTVGGPSELNGGAIIYNPDYWKKCSSNKVNVEKVRKAHAKRSEEGVALEVVGDIVGSGNVSIGGELSAEEINTAVLSALGNAKVGTLYNIGELYSTISIDAGATANIIKFTLLNSTTSVHVKFYLVATVQSEYPLLSTIELLLLPDGTGTLLSQKNYLSGSELETPNYLKVILPSGDDVTEGEVLVKFQYNGSDSLEYGKLLYEVIGKDVSVADVFEEVAES